MIDAIEYAKKSDQQNGKSQTQQCEIQEFTFKTYPLQLIYTPWIDDTCVIITDGENIEKMFKYSLSYVVQIEQL